MWMPETGRRARYFIHQAQSAKDCVPFILKTDEPSTTDDGGARYTRIDKVVAANDADRADEETALQESAGPTT